MRTLPPSLFLLALGLAVTASGQMRPATAPLELTAEERQWIEMHPVVKVGFSPSYPPYSMPAKDGGFEGLDLDYLALITARTGIKFVPIIARDWPAAEADFKAGRVQVLTALIGSRNQQETMRLSLPYFFAPIIIVSRIDTSYLLQPADLVGLDMGTVKGTLAAEGTIRTLLAHSKLREYDTAVELLQGLSRGEIEATLMDTVTAAYNIKTLHLTNLRMGSALGDPLPQFFGVTKSEPLLASIMDKAIASLSTTERRAIDDRWISLDLAPSKWILAFKAAMVTVITVAGLTLLLYLRHRRLAHELEERRRLLVQLEEAHTRLSRFSEQKSDLMRMVAHDIRSPLTGIILASDWARLTPPGDETSLREIIEGMRSAAQQLHRLASDLVDAQSSEDGHRIFSWAKTNVAQLIIEVLANHVDAARRKQVQIARPEGTTDLTIVTDAAALRQVLDNLLSNAIKYTRPGSVVRIEASWHREKLRLEFIDQGPGINAQDLEYIFLRYGKGAARPTAGEKSTGLGLWIVESLVTGLHGWVHCESVVGQGSSFIVELPPTPPETNPTPPAAATGTV